MQIKAAAINGSFITVSKTCRKREERTLTFADVRLDATIALRFTLVILGR